ncbi:acyl-CoA dehydrogenase family protein [Halomarina halobia]|uniref:Acyl-CoA dehydrogenase family protein n=1 Tax=Halomarina halobia TaxID=3033386 RepID=A0ABD6AF63_9EURY|nr:acyl-CoA dehydrogenase family protein [Halomarina sp. PSR21]
MNFELTDEQKLLERTAVDLMDEYGLDYWYEKDETEEFPEEIWEDLVDAGFIGMKIPQEYGGEGFGMSELATASLAVARNGGGVSGANLLTSPVIGSTAIIEHGTEEQKRRLLSEIVDGSFVAIGLTEPNAGLDTAGIEMHAERDGDEYVLNGTKIWTTGGKRADYILTVARTSSPEEGARHGGISLFFVPTDDDGFEFNKIDKLSMRALGSYETVFDDVRVSAENLIGTEGEGFFHVLNTLNTERINWAAIPVGAGELALNLAVNYAGEREAFERQIGRNQGIQFPLAENKADLETAKLMIYKAAWLYDNGHDCAMEANAAKLVGAKAGFDACNQAVQTYGGMGFANEYHVERLFRDVRLAQVAPVSDELVKAYIGEHVLDLPRSY